MLVAALLCAALTGQAQETVMNVVKKDGTTSKTRVAELSQISFLAAEAGSQGLQVKSVGGETASVLFASNPIVTISNGKLNVKANGAESLEFELTDVAEILFSDASDETAIRVPEGFSFVVQDSGALLRGLPAGAKPRVYTLDGRRLPTPPVVGSELRLSRATLGAGLFVVKVGTFSAIIHL